MPSQLLRDLFGLGRTDTERTNAEGGGGSNAGNRIRDDVRQQSFQEGSQTLSPRNGDPRAFPDIAVPRDADVAPTRPSQAVIGPRRVQSDTPLLAKAVSGATVRANIPADALVEAFEDRVAVDDKPMVLVMWEGKTGYVNSMDLGLFPSLGLRRTTEEMSLQREATLTAESVRMLPKHSEIECLTHRFQKGGQEWIAAQTDGVWGYVRTSKLGYPERVAGGQVPLREGPSNDTKTKKYVPRGATIQTTSAKTATEEGEWIQIRYVLDQASGAALTGWVLAEELQAYGTMPESRYREMYQQMQLNESGMVKRPDLEAWATRINENKSRYLAVSAETGMPWYAIGVIHMRESSLNFSRYLHNGDRLGRPTVNVPRNIPVFHEWEPSAIHALNQERSKFSKGLLEGLEGYNGYGYRNRGENSPYLWSGSDHYSSGKYVSDGRYSASTVDGQAGTASVLKMMEELGYCQIDPGAL